MIRALKDFQNNALRTNIFVNYMSVIVELLTGLVTMTVINRILGVDVYGIIITLLAFFSVIKAFITVNNQSAITKYISISIYKKNIEKYISIFSYGMIVDLLSWGIFLVVVLIIKYLSSETAYSFGFSNQIFQIFLTGISFNILSASFIGILHGHQKFKTTSLINITANLCKAIFICVFISKGILYVALGYLLSDIVKFSFFLFLGLKIFLKNKGKFLFNPLYFKEYFEFIKFNFFSLSIKSIISKSDIILLNYFTNSYTVGQFETIKKLFIPLNFIAPSISSALFPKFSKYSVKNEITELKRVIYKGTKFITPISLAYIIIISLFSEYYSNLQNIKIDFLVFITLSFYFFLNSSMWWGSIYFQNFDVKFPLFTNLTLLISTLILVPITLHFIENKVLAIAIGTLISYIPSFTLGIFHLIKKLNYEKNT
ncbi:oligosaccharide flippase family protein [Flavobacteriaceae bacterium]|nr:oligosaccharide flippase family protein [Flavobacteriaceae bacterium]